MGLVGMGSLWSSALLKSSQANDGNSLVECQLLDSYPALSFARGAFGSPFVSPEGKTCLFATEFSYLASYQNFRTL